MYIALTKIQIMKTYLLLLLTISLTSCYPKYIRDYSGLKERCTKMYNDAIYNALMEDNDSEVLRLIEKRDKELSTLKNN